MSADYILYLSDPLGNRLTVIDQFLRLEYTLSVNAVSSLTLTLPDSFDMSLIREDSRLEINRSINGATPYLEGGQHWFIRKPSRMFSTATINTITAVGAADLLRRRIIAYPAGTAYTSKTAEADNVMKALVRENLGDLVDANRDYTDNINISAYLTVQNDASIAAPTIAIACTRDNLLSTLQKIANASTQAGTYLAFDIVWNGSMLEFGTYTTARGNDHRFPNGVNPITLSVENGTLTEAEYTQDYTEEVTIAIAGGEGVGVARQISVAVDTTRRDASPFNAIEVFAQGNMTAGDATALGDIAEGRVRQGRPRIILAGRIQQTDAVQYGREWGWGDYVTIEVAGVTSDARIDTVTVTVEGGQETIDARIRNDG